MGLTHGLTAARDTFCVLSLCVTEIGYREIADGADSPTTPPTANGECYDTNSHTHQCRSWCTLHSAGLVIWSASHGSGTIIEQSMYGSIKIESSGDFTSIQIPNTDTLALLHHIYHMHTQACRHA